MLKTKGKITFFFVNKVSQVLNLWLCNFYFYIFGGLAAGPSFQVKAQLHEDRPLKDYCT